MDFAPPRRPVPLREPVLPMINVVFLLLIFFLMTAQIAPPDMLEVTPPDAMGGDVDGPDARGAPQVLFVAADGMVASDSPEGGVSGDAALAMLDPDRALSVRADRDLPAHALAALLARLAVIGVTDVMLVVTPHGSKAAP